MKRRDLLRSLGGVGAVTAVGRVLNPATAGGQSFPASSKGSATDNLASRLAASIQTDGDQSKMMSRGRGRRASNLVPGNGGAPVPALARRPVHGGPAGAAR